jgi:hypothetical protein
MISWRAALHIFTACFILGRVATSVHDCFCIRTIITVIVTATFQFAL